VSARRKAQVRGVIAAASLALCLGGIGSVTQGVAVPVKAEVAQHSLEQVFEQRLAANMAPETAPAVRVERSRDTLRPVSRLRSTQTGQAIFASFPTTGPVARLTVARLGVKDVVLAGEATHDQLAKGPTVLKYGDATSPVTILAAHRDTHFLFIRDLREGDEMRLQLVTGEIRRYRVVRFETVRWDAFAYPRDPARPLLALTTCFPFGGTEYGGPWRRVAWAEEIA
jgi:sortase A